MGRVTKKHGRASGLSRNIDDLALFSEKLIHFSSRQSRSLISRTLDLFDETIVESTKDRFKRSCKIPETNCPPRCVCEFSWEASRGEKGFFTARVTNTGTQQRNFSFSSTPFYGPGNPSDTMVVEPAGVNLKPGESVVVKMSFTVTDQFVPNNRYETEVLIQGAYEQCIKIVLHVESSEVGHCTIEQGETPTRIRAHRWYHHFQCEEPCFSDREGDTSSPKGRAKKK